MDGGNQTFHWGPKNHLIKIVVYCCFVSIPRAYTAGTTVHSLTIYLETVDQTPTSKSRLCIFQELENYWTYGIDSHCVYILYSITEHSSMRSTDLRISIYFRMIWE